MEKRKGITVAKSIIAVSCIVILILIGTFIILKKDEIFNKKVETSSETETSFEKENNDGEKYIEGLIKIDQSDFETTKAQQTISGINLIEQNIEEMWYKVESDNGDKQYKNIKYNNETWETEKFLLAPEENKITVFAKANNQLYCSNTIKAYYDSGNAYELNPENIKYDEKEKEYYVNVVIIDFEDEVSETRRNEIVKSINGQVVGRINVLDEFHVEVPHDSLTDLKKLCDRLEKMDEVSMAFLDSINIMDQEEISWEGKVDVGNGWHIPIIEAIEAWDYQENNSKEFANIKIGILDSGFIETHNDLNIEILNSDTNDKVEKKNHGTQVAGIIGGKYNEQDKIRGIMSNANMYCFSIERVGIIENLFVSSAAKIREGLTKLVQKDCKVINFSQGLDLRNKYCDEKLLSDSQIKENGEQFSKAVGELLAQGHDFIVVQSAGNGAKTRENEKVSLGVDAIYSGLFASITEENCYSNNNVSKNEIMDRIIIVTSTDSVNKRVESANGGKQVTIAAPGDGIYTVPVINEEGQKTNLFKGTSAAAPIVTGVAGLIWSTDEKNLTGKQVKDIILSSCIDISRNNSISNTYGKYPIVNAKRAVEKVLQKKGLIEKDEQYNYEVISEEDKTIAIVNGKNLSGKIKIPAFLDGYKVIKIKERAFSYCKEIEEIEIPDSVKEIGREAFEGCSNLSQLELGNSVEILGNRTIKDTAIESIIIPKSVKEMSYAIHENLQLKEVTFEEGIKKIPNYALAPYNSWEYGMIENVRIPNTVEEIGECAFQACKGIKQIEIPNSVIKIGDRAFSYCEGIKGIKIPNSMTNIGEGVFEQCTGIEEIAIPSNIIEIGAYAFNWCTGIRKIEISNSVIKIDNGTFSYCTGIEQIQIPDSVKEIGREAFEGCRKLTQLDFGNGVEKLGNRTIKDTAIESIIIPKTVKEMSYAIHENPQLKEVIFEEGIKKIPNYALSPYNSWEYGMIKNVRIPNTVEEIGEYAFQACKGINQIEIPNSVIKIGNRAFNGCTGIQNIVIPHSVTDIGEGTFTECTGIEEIVIPSSVTEIRRATFNLCRGIRRVEIPYSVAKIGESAFSYCTEIEQIEIPDSVKEIGEWAFEGCSKLSQIDLGNGVEKLGRDTIKETAIQSIIIPKSIKYMREAIRENPQLKEVIFEEGIKRIPNWALRGVIEKVVIPNTVEEIGERAFEGCTKIKTIEIPNSVVKIGDVAFGQCAGIQNIIIPNSVTDIGNFAFSSCTEILEVKIPDSVKEIGESAFSGCKKLSQIDFGNGVETLGRGVVSNTAIQSVIIPKSIKYMGYAIYDNPQLKEVIFEEGTKRIPDSALSAYYSGEPSTIEKVVIPNTVEEIGSEAFENCTGIKQIELPNSITKIGQRAFENCTGIEYLVIPNSVIEIGSYAFIGCTGMKEIQISNNVTNLGWDICNGCGNQLTILCYKNSNIYNYAVENNINYKVIG